MSNKKNNNRKNPMPQSGGGGNQIIIVLLLTMVVVMAVMYFQKNPQEKAVEWDYSTVVQKVKEGAVTEVTIVDQNIRNGKAFETVNGKINETSFYSFIPFTANGFVDLLIENNVKVKGEENKPSYFSIILVNLLPILAIGFLLWFFMFRQVQGSNNRAMSFGKSRARLLTKEDVKVTFKDVEGCKEAKEEFNLQSPKQLEYILFTKLKLPTAKKTKTGFSTDEEVLSELAKKYKIAENMITYRKYSKLKNTYLDVFPTLVNKSTNRIHAYFNQTVTATGRLSSSEPNLQNIPVKGEEGKDIRNTFIAEKGNLLISADYSQIELRLLAHFSKDPTLVEAFKNNDDIHKKTAMKIYSVSKEHITPSMRNTAKIINFSIIYGKTAFGLSKELDIKRKEADEFIKSYFETYSQVKPFCEEAIKEIKNKGYVRTMMGRIRDLSKTINSSNSVVRNEAERMALNTLIQGSAADMIKVAMIGIHREFKNHFKTAKIVMQVHDELVVEVSEEESDRAMKVMKDIMEHSVKANVPIVVDIHKGKSWGEIH